MKTYKGTLMSCLLGGALLMVPTSLWAKVYGEFHPLGDGGV